MKHRLIWLGVLLTLGLGLVVLRLALPSIVERQLNARLADMGEYTGHLEQVDLAIWRGSYTLHKLQVQKRYVDVPVPLLDAPTVDISLSWGNLLRGSIVADVSFEQPTVHFVDGEGKTHDQSGLGVDWRESLENLVPTQLNDVVFHNGTVIFHNFVSDPPVDLKATQVNASIINLTNVRGVDDRRVAELNATGFLFETAKLESVAHFDPFDERARDFSFALRVLEIDLTRINDLAQAYANLDFESGNGELVLELEATDGILTGYIKPLFQQLKIFSWKGDVVEGDKNPFKVVWEILAAGVTELFTNQPADQFGTRMEINGDISNPDISTTAAIIGILRNAFVEALQPYFEGDRPETRDEK